MFEKWLAPTWYLDSDSQAVSTFAARAVGDAHDPVEVGRALFYAVRDQIRYDPYVLVTSAEALRASRIAQSARNWCTPKSILLAAAARNRGIPARLGFADVRNHLTTPKLSAKMGTDLFVWHGYAELWLNSRWVKLSTAFNIELCQRFGVKTLEYDPVNGALMHPFDVEGQQHMEYVVDRGSYDDVPVAAMFETFTTVYPDWEAVQGWRAETARGNSAERDTAFD